MNYFVKKTRYLCLLLVTICMIAGCGKTEESKPENQNTQDTTIHFISFSDFHGAVDNTTSSKNPGMDKFVSAVKSYTSKESKEDGYVVVVGGDSYQGTAISNLSHGKVINDMYKEIGVKYSAIGNHEYDWGTGYFDTWQKEGGFTFLAANIVNYETGKLVDYAKPYGIVEKNGKKIGVIGITTPETKTATLLENVSDVKFEDPIVTVNKYAKQLREEEKVDAVIVLSHIGSAKEEDGTITGEVEELANGVEGVDAILSGHTHNSIEGEVNGIPILGTTNNGRELGLLSLEFKSDGLAINYGLINLTDQIDTLEIDPEAKAIYDKYEEELSPMLSEVITVLPMNLTHERDIGQTDLGQYCSKLLTQITKCQIGLFNAGGIRTSLEAGDITVGDMYTVFPFDNTIVTMELSGADIKSNLEYGLNPDNEVGILQYYGVNVTMDMTKPVGERITSLTLLDGTKVEPDKYYTVATNSFLASNGDGFDFFNATNVVDGGVVLREALVEELRKVDRIEFKKEENYKEQ